MSEKEIKEKTIKWLSWHMDEINNNILAVKMTTDDKELYYKDLKEIQECIDYVRNKKPK
jgi:hypothetical protein